MTHYPKAIQDAIQELSHLPGIGTKTAERLVLSILRKKKQDQTALTASLTQLQNNIRMCTLCGYVTDNSDGICAYCKDASRNNNTICVVADMQTLQVIEKSGVFHGAYHVLGGTINPIEGISADMLNIESLLQRVRSAKTKIREVLLATGTDIEGEQTALFLAQKLKPLRVKITRLARGIPRGSNLEYADEMTLADAIQNRQQV
ncbi:MAG: recombination protein RecR [Candidatus Kerfeldbacteria bacterium CG08_land_8_20_14_0_20_42_7]|uniref:Recombination protein RecR n=1 Tax=Candidatus Kerfeldbacteria bacterium CG08_land_8_20_14_0_20_42_7 TaxID=2014245 RepID=A0A2H0YT35_9BACT|nr:MAG: recombination protein RecR [Candidatus Kerfeldbacteria bacterium CG08_land_8_20_14_0_20_42_7]